MNSLFEIVFLMKHSAKKNIAYDAKLDAQPMVPLAKLRFQIRVFAWVLTENHDIYGQHNFSCGNVFLSNLVYSLSLYNVSKNR